MCSSCFCLSIIAKAECMMQGKSYDAWLIQGSMLVHLVEVTPFAINNTIKPHKKFILSPPKPSLKKRQELSGYKHTLTTASWDTSDVVTFNLYAQRGALGMCSWKIISKQHLWRSLTLSQLKESLPVEESLVMLTTFQIISLHILLKATFAWK